MNLLQVSQATAKESIEAGLVKRFDILHIDEDRRIVIHCVLPKDAHELCASVRIGFINLISIYCEDEIQMRQFKLAIDKLIPNLNNQMQIPNAVTCWMVKCVSRIQSQIKCN